MASRNLAAFVALTLALSLGLTACGRRPATLLTPYEAAVEAREEAIEAGEDPAPPEPARPPVDRPFILDRLI